MISYDNFWETMKKRGVTKYSLIYHYGISSNTLRRMSHGESITTSTVNELCLILHCKPQDILSFEITEEEKAFTEQREAAVSMKKKKRTQNENSKFFFNCYLYVTDDVPQLSNILVLLACEVDHLPLVTYIVFRLEDL